MPQSESELRHVLDHIIARQHGGKTELTNLALCCGRCNQFKGPNIAGIDPESPEPAGITRLFNPRTDRWHEHFRYHDPILVGLTPVGRATISTLAINQPLRVMGRQRLIEVGTTF